MLDLSLLTDKQRQFIHHLLATPKIASLREHCDRHEFDFNFAKGFLLSDVLKDSVELRKLGQPIVELTAKGNALNGILPGTLLVEKLKQNITDFDQLQTILGESFGLHYNALRKEQAVNLVTKDDPKNGTKTLEILDRSILETFEQRQQLFTDLLTPSSNLPATSPEALTWLIQQDLIVQRGATDYAVTLLKIGEAIANLSLTPSVTTLTSALLFSDDWKTASFKPYNIHDQVADIAYGRPSILTQCIQRIRTIFLEMGFDEMAGCMVESTFWNFDALFTPQDHPAREIQDTFYLSQPQTLPLPADPDLINRVKQVHEQHYSATWTEAEASRAILRAHTTTSTARKLYQLWGSDQSDTSLQGLSQQSGKYFSIDKVFRNETLDRTHLAEFHQIEGVVIGGLVSVRTLMGYLSYFYSQLGFQKLKFKPTYNPYTEPSLEVYAYHAPSQKYLEVGNSGLFRTEMLEPLGCKGKLAIAWGLGLERIAMLLYDVEKLSDLIGADTHLSHY
jgi:phenylalanyl-tRNA synthetase alpha chain